VTARYIGLSQTFITIPKAFGGTKSPSDRPPIDKSGRPRFQHRCWRDSWKSAGSWCQRGPIAGSALWRMPLSCRVSSRPASTRGNPHF